MTEQNAMTDEMILVPRAELIAWAKAWQNDYGPNDGTDCVTPFDLYLMKAPAEAQPAGDDRWKALIGQWQRQVEDAGYVGVEDALDAAIVARDAGLAPSTPVGVEVKVLARDEHLVLIARALGDALSAHEQLEDEAGWSPLDLAQLRKAAQAVYEMGGEP